MMSQYQVQEDWRITYNCKFYLGAFDDRVAVQTIFPLT